MIPCPKCDGGKNELVSFPAFPHGKMLEKMRKMSVEELKSFFPCYQCNGKGEITEEMLQWISDGHILKDRRIRAQLTLMQAAHKLGILPSELSYMETGKISPNMSISY
jgi:hypothetical protein